MSQTPQSTLSPHKNKGFPAIQVFRHRKMETITISLEKFDFDYWTNNRIKVLLTIIDRKIIDDVKTLSIINGLSYASTHQIISEFKLNKLILRGNRTILIHPEWQKNFTSMHRRP